MSFNLSATEIRNLEKLHKTIGNKRIADRVKAVIALGKGYSFDEIQDILLISERSVRRYFSLYKEIGKDGLLILNYKGGIPKLTEEQESELCQHIENNLYSTSAEIVDYLKQKYDIKYTSDGLVIALHRLGFYYKKTKILPGKADRKKQEAFIQVYEKMREEQKSDEKVYFMDGVHPTHNVIPAYANLIERLWKFFKKKVLHNKYYQTIRDFEKAIDDFFTCGVKEYRPEIMRLLVEKFQLFSNS